MGLWIEIPYQIPDAVPPGSASAMGLWIEIACPNASTNAWAVSLCDGAVD